MDITCPVCRRTIPTADVNVSTDIALCRACDRTFSFAELLNNAEDASFDLSRPPSGAWFRETPHGFVVGASTRSLLALFLVPFMCLWSGLSLGGIYGHQIKTGHFNLMESLFGIPFLIGTFALLGAAIMSILGKIEVQVNDDYGTVFTGTSSIGWTRRFQWSEVKQITEDVQGYNNGRPMRVIVLEGVRRVRFGSGLREERRDFLLRVLRMMHRRKM